jgi:hypothetical protein
MHGGAMSSKKPSARDFLSAFDGIDKELVTLEGLMSNDPRFLPNKAAAISPKVGLLGLYPTIEDTLARETAINEAIIQEVTRVESFTNREPTIAWVKSQKQYAKLEASLERQAKLKVSSQFNKPNARFKLLKATLIGIGQHGLYIDHGESPGQMTSKDWGKAIEAVKTLRDLEANNGLRLWKAFPKESRVTWDWCAYLERRLIEGKAEAPKPYNDGLSSDRDATRLFTVWLLMLFDEAPPAMVEKFAVLIGYETDSIARQVKAWERAHRSDSLT